MTDEFPRPLTEGEHDILDFLLAVDAPGVDALRAQAATAQVVGRCECGCATIDIAVDRDTTQASAIRHSPAIDARTPLSSDSAESHELIVFLDEGWLASIEIVYHTDTPPTEFPPPSLFLPAYLSNPPSTKEPQRS
jgi:hypothetical protein